MTHRAPHLVVAAVGGVVLTTGTVALTLATAPAHHRAWAACAYGLIVAVPFVVGLWVLARNPADRFARLLLVAGTTWSAVALVGSSDAALYSLGRVALWLA